MWTANPVHYCTGCFYCLRPMQTLNRGGDSPDQRRRAMSSRVEQQVQNILADHASDTEGWFGGREVTQPPKPPVNRFFGCFHREYTAYTIPTPEPDNTSSFELRFFCRQCGNWLDSEPVRP